MEEIMGTQEANGPPESGESLSLVETQGFPAHLPTYAVRIDYMQTIFHS